CFSAELCCSSARPEKSDGNLSDKRLAQFTIHFAHLCGDLFNDDFILPDARIAAAIRPELSLSISGFERHLHHAGGSGDVEGKTKLATYSRSTADQRGDRTGFAPLAINFRATPKYSALAATRFGKRTASPTTAAARAFLPRRNG